MNKVLVWSNYAKDQLKLKNLAPNSVNLILESVYGSDYQVQMYSGMLKFDEKLDKLLTKVLACKIPIAYLVGFEYFYGRKFYVDNRVLIPRIETENLIFHALTNIKEKFKNQKKIKILDLCTGSGIIGITTYLELQSEFAIELTMADISDDALEVCRKNLQLNNVKAKIQKTDLFEEINETFDIILTNPPYVPYDQELGIMVDENEPHLALFAENKGLALYQKIAQDYSEYVNENYLIGIEIGDGQEAAIMEMMKQRDNKVIAVKDLFNRERNVFIWSKNDM